MTAKNGAAAAAPMSGWACGFREPWIEWDGVEGVGHDAGLVLVDGLPVPATATECNVAHRVSPESILVDDLGSVHHQPHHDHCFIVLGDTPWTRSHGCVGEVQEPDGFAFGFHLENGLVARVMVGETDSFVVLARGWDSEGEVDVVTRDDVTYAQVCARECCRDPETDRVRSTNHLGGTFEFESRDELMAIIDRLSRLEVREERVVRPAPTARADLHPAARSYGTVTLEEWQAGKRVTP